MQRHGRVLFVGKVLFLAAAASLAYWPATRAFLETDDYTLLAFARILHQPLALFGHEHFPLGPYFRPLPMLLWWISARAFGNALMPQYALNLLLHIGVSLQLWRLLGRISHGSRAAWIVALLFAVHPAAVGTALWLSDRFDLLATLFALLALDAAFASRGPASRWRVCAAFSWVVCALLSKESGIVAAAAVIAAWLWPCRGVEALKTRLPQPAAAAALAGVVLAWIAWRAAVAHAALSLMVNGAASPATLVGAGSIRWAIDFGTYALAWGRMHAIVPAVFAGGVVLVAAGAAATRFWRATHAPRVAVAPVLACAAVILCVFLAMEAPYAYMWTVKFPGIADPAPVATYSRLFYFPLCAVAMAAVAAAESVARRCADRFRRQSLRLAGAGAALLACAWASVAHDLADGYRRETATNRPVVTAAVEAVTRAGLPPENCRLFLLDVAMRDSGYMLKALPDAVIKALVPDEHSIEHCLIQTEQAAWENIVGGERLTQEAALPMRPMYGVDGPVPWIHVGGLQVVYLNLFADVDPRALQGAVFLRQRGATFEDVTAAVRDGSLGVHFTCARAPAQCRR
jgi:hypothetical protein